MKENANGTAAAGTKKGGAASAMKPKTGLNGQPMGGPQGIRPEDKPDSPEYKKKQAMIKGPVLELTQENSDAYGMDECTFTGLKDIFMALTEANTRTGVLSPQRFLEMFRRGNEMFRNSMHQDAHEFYYILMNDVIQTVTSNAARIQEKEAAKSQEGLAQSVEKALGASNAVIEGQSGTKSPGTGWVHDIFEGLMTSETRCLTCETASQRDETFLDLSIDLEEHSSVTSCLRKFSAEEMLCERNKFHCDRCGGLQEAEKRMKIKRLPKVLALHLKRFKYSEDYTKLEKLFYRVVYPYYLRMFNTTDDAEDPDRLYELYAVVVHIGGNAYHGHYVSIIKHPKHGWLLFDDEMVEPVDKHFVRNFFGDKPGTACAYVLFYQETTFEKMVAEQEADGLQEVQKASQQADMAAGTEHVNGLSKTVTTPISPVDDREELISLDHARTAPGSVGGASSAVPPVPPIPETIPETHPLVAAPPPEKPGIERKDTKPEARSKEDKKREKEEAKAAEKARKAAEKEQIKADVAARRERETRLREARRNEAEELQKALAASRQSAADEDKTRKKDSDEIEPPAKSPGFLNRSNRASKSMSRKSFAFLAGKDKEKEKGEAGGATEAPQNGARSSSGAAPEKHALKERFSFGLGRKKSTSLNP